jgi:hypothetical protein
MFFVLFRRGETAVPEVKIKYIFLPKVDEL